MSISSFLAETVSTGIQNLISRATPAATELVQTATKAHSTIDKKWRNLVEEKLAKKPSNDKEPSLNEQILTILSGMTDEMKKLPILPEHWGEEIPETGHDYETRLRESYKLAYIHFTAKIPNKQAQMNVVQDISKLCAQFDNCFAN